MSYNRLENCELRRDISMTVNKPERENKWALYAYARYICVKENRDIEIIQLDNEIEEEIQSLLNEAENRFGKIEKIEIDEKCVDFIDFQIQLDTNLISLKDQYYCIAFQEKIFDSFDFMKDLLKEKVAYIIAIYELWRKNKSKFENMTYGRNRRNPLFTEKRNLCNELLEKSQSATEKEFLQEIENFLKERDEIIANPYASFSWLSYRSDFKSLVTDYMIEIGKQQINKQEELSLVMGQTYQLVSELFEMLDKKVNEEGCHIKSYEQSIDCFPNEYSIAKYKEIVSAWLKEYSVLYVEDGISYNMIERLLHICVEAALIELYYEEIVEKEIEEYELKEGDAKFIRGRNEPVPAVSFWKDHKLVAKGSRLSCGKQLKKTYIELLDSKGLRKYLIPSKKTYRKPMDYSELFQICQKNKLDTYFINSFIGFYEILKVFDKREDGQSKEYFNNVFSVLGSVESSYLRSEICNIMVSEGCINEMVSSFDKITVIPLANPFGTELDKDKAMDFSKFLNYIYRRIKEVYQQQLYVSESDFWKKVFRIVSNHRLEKEVKHLLNRIYGRYADIENVSGFGKTKQEDEEWKDICSSYYETLCQKGQMSEN